MQSVPNYLRAFRRPFTYDVRRNPYLWFGFLWGLPIPLLSLLMDLSFSGPVPRTVWECIRQHPIHALFIAHPFLFAIGFGAMGAVRRSLEEENRALIGKLTELAMTDGLTGIYNRRYLMEELKNGLLRARRPGHPLSIVLFDLDRFKAVNDEQGHLAGDRVLRKTAQALQEVVRQGDSLGRYGGDEFLLLVHGTASTAGRIADRAVTAVRRRARMEISYGLAHSPYDGITAEELIRAADGRLNRIKKEHYEAQGLARRG